MNRESRGITGGSARRRRSERTSAVDGSSPNSRRARRWRSRSQHWSSATSSSFKRALSAAVAPRPSSSRVSVCSSSTSALILCDHLGVIHERPLSRYPAISARRFSMVVNASLNDSANDSTPSRSSVSVTSSKSTPAAARSRITRNASSTFSVTVFGRWLPSPLCSASIEAGRQGVHRVGPDELVDIERGGVRGVLGGGRRPERPLEPRALRRERLPPRARRSGRGRAGTRAWRWRPRPSRAARDPRGGACRSRCRPGSRRTTPPTRSSTGRRRSPRTAPSP